MNPSEIAEHDRLYPLRRSDESADAFLRRCIMEHRLSHELYVEMLRKNPELATEATCGMAYQQRAVHRYDEMLAALAEIVERAIEESRGQPDKYKSAIKTALKVANGRWCEWGSRAESVETILTDALEAEEAMPLPDPPEGNENV